MEEQNEKINNIYAQRLSIIIVADILMVVFAYMFAAWIRFDFKASVVFEGYGHGLLIYLPIIIVFSLLVYYFTNLYRSVWRYAGAYEVSMIFLSYFIILIFAFVIDFFFEKRMPYSIVLLGTIFSMIGCFVIRFGYRLARYLFNNRVNLENDSKEERILLVGGGAAGREIILDLKYSKNRKMKICAIADDNRYLKGRRLEGIRIEGNRYEIPNMVERYDINKIVFAIPSAKPQDRVDILNICKETGCKVQTVPGMLQLVNGEVNINTIRDVAIEDLLGREEVHINQEEIFNAIQGKVIMVTGGGGSIGSELCRQIAAANPKQLIIFDIYENNAYEIQQELKRKYPDLDLIVLIGSVRNTSRVNWILNKYKPEVVYHAAAHKHVPLMEDSPNEAIKNNVLGTYKVATAAGKNGVKRFLLISTDKAVNPTNIMGASKRLCEMVVQMMDRRYPNTAYTAVRFGNVLGSNGSVIPLFKKQIAEGGPVTVTDKNIIRYFMTIPEAVSLVLESSYYANGGEIFVLDMGKPVRIDDMARNLIKLSGFTPDVDIKVEYTGLRPGEKLFEELLMDEEGLKKTKNKMIYIGNPIEMDDELFEKQIRQLDHESRNESNNIKEIVASIVPTYKPELK